MDLGLKGKRALATKTAQIAIARGVAEFFATARPSSILHRFAATSSGAALIVYVCSAKASATTGAALRVDGGVVRAIP
jgi:NAD(P)-dependent dehydrogenase (short-subunit alcohol dehydrogenase family)